MRSKRKHQRGGDPDVLPPLFFSEWKFDMVDLEIQELLEVYLRQYNIIRSFISPSVKTVFYPGMADDILLPLLGFNAQTIIAIDAVDPAYAINGASSCFFENEIPSRVDCENRAQAYINIISKAVEAFGGTCKSIVREQMNSPLTAGCPTMKFTYTFTFPSFSQADVQELRSGEEYRRKTWNTTRKLIYYVPAMYGIDTKGLVYGLQLKEIILGGIDAYITVGAPSFLENQKWKNIIMRSLARGTATHKAILISEGGSEDVELPGTWKAHDIDDFLAFSTAYAGNLDSDVAMDLSEEKLEKTFGELWPGQPYILFIQNAQSGGRRKSKRRRRRRRRKRKRKRKRTRKRKN